MHNEELKEYYDKQVPKLSVTNVRHQRVFKSFDALIPANIHVLDIGCGTGITSKYLAKNRNVWALDISENLINYAKQHNNDKNISYFCMDACNPIFSKLFDAIIMVDVLEHVVDVVGLFESIKNLSHEQTKIYLNIPSEDVLLWLQENKPDLLQIVDNPISVSRIIELFKRINFLPTYFNMYWNHYQEFLFVHESEQEKIFNTMYKGA